ncbi:MAG: secretin N-terminal domain-containing protein, partial [Verrucomicrobiota bacterium]
LIQFGEAQQRGEFQPPRSYKEEATVQVNFPNSPVSSILPYYERLTGKRIIRDANLQGVNLTVISEEALTKRDAIAFIDSVFLLNGYAMIPVYTDTLKIININGGKNPRSHGLPVIMDPKELPEGDGVVNFIMPLENISPKQAIHILNQAVTLNSYGAMAPLEHTGSLLITENVSNIHTILNLTAKIDVPPTRVENKFVKLQRADAEKVAEMIGRVIEAQHGGETGVAGGPAPVNAANGEGTASVTASLGSSKATIISYRRTNSILIVGRPQDVAYIEGLAQTFDQPADGVTFLKRKLQYISINDYLPAFYNALARGTDIEAEDTALDPNALTANTLQNSAAAGTNGNRAQFGAAGAATSITAPDRLGDPESVGRPQSYTVGNTLLIADPQANSLIVSGSPEHLEIVEKLIDEIDVEPMQVYISTVIGQLTIGDDVSYSLNALQTLETFQANSGNQAAGAGSFFSDLANPATIASLTNASGFPAAAGLRLYGQFAWGSDDATTNATLSMFARDSRFKVLSRPSVYAQNNVKAVISSGQRIAIPTSTLTTTSGIQNGGLGLGGVGANGLGGSIASNIEFRDVVLKLEVIPLINSDDQVTLKIAQLNDNIVGSQTISNNEIPTLSTQELITTVSVKNGSTIVLGGLITGPLSISISTIEWTTSLC